MYRSLRENKRGALPETGDQEALLEQMAPEQGFG